MNKNDIKISYQSLDIKRKIIIVMINFDTV